jgi:hypothetical protein
MIRTEGRALQSVIKKVVGIHVLPIRSLFGGGILRGVSFASASAQ